MDFPFRELFLALCLFLSLAFTAWFVRKKENKIPALIFGILSVGAFLNFLVVASNGGKMPVAIAAGDTKEIAVISQSNSWRVMDEATRFAMLGDWISIPVGQRALIFSIGDVISSVAFVIYVCALLYYFGVHIRKKFFKKE